MKVAKSVHQAYEYMTVYSDSVKGNVSFIKNLSYKFLRDENSLENKTKFSRFYEELSVLANDTNDEIRKTVLNIAQKGLRMFRMKAKELRMLSKGMRGRYFTEETMLEVPFPEEIERVEVANKTRNKTTTSFLEGESILTHFYDVDVRRVYEKFVNIIYTLEKKTRFYFFETSFKNATFIGEINWDGKPQGVGKEIENGKVRFIGMFCDGKRHGIGVELDSESGIIVLQGTWMNGVFASSDNSHQCFKCGIIEAIFSSWHFTLANYLVEKDILKVDYKKLVVRSKEIVRICGLKQFSNLSVLDLSKNPIRRIEGLEYLKSLKEVVLNDTQISKIEGLETLSELECLSLCSSWIKKLEGIQHLVRLKRLCVGNNEIESLVPLKGMSSLTVLEVDHNKIVSIEGIQELKSLKRLNVTGNRHLDVKDLTNAVTITKFTRRWGVQVEIEKSVLDAIYAQMNEFFSALDQVSEDGLSLGKCSDVWRNEKEIVVTAVQQNPMALKYSPEKMKELFVDDFETMIKFVEKEVDCFCFASERLRNSEKFILDSIKNEEDFPKIMEFVSKNLKNNKHFMKCVVSKDPNCIIFATDNLKKDGSFVLELIRDCYSNLILENVSSSLKFDLEFLEKCVGVNIQVLTSVEKILKQPEKLSFFARMVKNKGPNCLNHVSERLKGNREFIMQIIKVWMLTDRYSFSMTLFQFSI